MTEAAKPRKSRKSAAKGKTQAPNNGDAAAGAGDAGLPARACGSPAVNAESKTFRVLALLRRKKGVTLDEVVEETGWQPHTARAALTGLRKKGHVITSEKIDDVRRYRADDAK